MVKEREMGTLARKGLWQDGSGNVWGEARGPA